ncbi:MULTISPECIES: ABC transporter ATP-binding protein [Metabacillus]|uniref:ABC transporter ATP-binding protein n=1 Tax=Metabacillus hrfriensis TaxID=3048891 RepID=A0ACD4RG06_9BACI|nr:MULTISPECIES: ABC transporter ATP-binding protein [Metabacillus]UAL53828.1 ABC transporter ATP-binding protein [Metabacillus dongyingensis]WHZ59384.1 ABC transporter ATP-binding protein [Metabacillus sp. CT-WN-B3]
MAELMILTTNLTKVIKKKTIVDSLDMKIEKGEIYGFLGPNGAGKTTTIKMLLGLMKPTGGTIELFGKNAADHQLESLRKMGSLVESPSYYGHLTARENLETIRKILQVQKSRIDEVLSIVRLTNDSNRPVKGFSLGMKQRLGIASAILGNPELLILDEPTNGLDPSGIHEMRDLIKRLPREYGMTVLISSHLLSEIDQMATKVGIISKGKMIFQDSISKLKSKAKEQVIIRTGNSVKAASLLLSNGQTAEQSGKSVILRDMTDSRIAQVIALLVKSGIEVYRVEEKRKSLEEIFLDLTGEGGNVHDVHSKSRSS